MARVLGQEEAEFIAETLWSSSDDDGPFSFHRICREEVVKQLLPVIKRKWRGSVNGRKRIDYARNYQRILEEDYFGIDGRPPRFTDAQFRAQFRMSRPRYLQLESRLLKYPCFQLRFDSANVKGHTPRAKILCALMQLVDGSPSRSTLNYLRIPKASSHQYLKHFVACVLADLEDEYMRAPNREDVARLLQLYESRGLPGPKSACLQNMLS
jgi:hypothetical protein